MQEEQQVRRSTRLLVRDGTWMLKQSTVTGELIPQRPPSLLDLPAEIRLRILKCLLCSKDPIHGHRYFYQFDDNHWQYYKKQPIERNFEFHPVILRVNRQLYEEGKSLLYFHNSLDVLINSYGIMIYDHDLKLQDFRPQNDRYDPIAINANFEFFQRFPRLSIKVLYSLGSLRSTLKRNVNELVSVIIENTRTNIPPRHLTIEYVDEHLTTDNYAPYGFCICKELASHKCRCVSEQRERDFASASTVLSPLRRLTDVNSITFSGFVPLETQRHLTPRIISPSQKPPDLQAMFEATARFVHAIERCGYVDHLLESLIDSDELHTDGIYAKEHASMLAYRIAVEKEMSVPHAINDPHNVLAPDTVCDIKGEIKRCGDWIKPGMRALQHANERDDVEGFKAMREALLKWARAVVLIVSQEAPYEADPESEGEDDIQDDEGSQGRD